MDRARLTRPGRAISEAGGRLASEKIRARDCWSVSTSAATSPGRSIRRPGRHGAAAAPVTLRKEVETCGLCHARRAGFHEDWVPASGYRKPMWSNRSRATPIMLTARSAMWKSHIIMRRSSRARCLPRASPAAIATSRTARGFASRAKASACNATPSDKYADAKHRHHAGVDPPPTCMSCHMPARTYMVVDPRHDHSFRIPRPDLSVKLGTPNACNDCHSDKSPQWAAAAVEQWFGPDRKGFQTYAAAFHAARTDAGRCRRTSCRRRGGWQCASHRARKRAWRTCASASRPRTSAWLEAGSPTPIQWYG